MHYDAFGDILRYWNVNNSAYEELYKAIEQASLSTEELATIMSTNMASTSDTQPEMDGDMPELDSFLLQLSDE